MENVFWGKEVFLRVGNFGDGHINMVDPGTGDFVSTVQDENNQPLQIDGLWSLTFGTNNGAGKAMNCFSRRDQAQKTKEYSANLNRLPDYKTASIKDSQQKFSYFLFNRDNAFHDNNVLPKRVYAFYTRFFC